MTTYPNCKINLGLYVVGKRPDGYHDLETIFLPVHEMHDELEINPLITHHSSLITQEGITLDNAPEDNLCMRAWRLLHDEFGIPAVSIRLKKGIPFGAGLGGGSSDAAFTLKMLNEMFGLSLTDSQLEQRAARLGADCAFFIDPQPQYAEGIGELLTPVSLSLKDWYIGVVRPDVPVSTKEAYSLITPKRPLQNCRDIVALPVEEWRDQLVNDFEEGIFSLHPELGQVKQRLYDLGAVYAAMSGSGSALFGLFREPVELEASFPNTFTWSSRL